VRLEGLGQWKNLMTSSGIEPATFRLAAQCLNQLLYRVYLLKSTLVSDVTPCIPVEFHRRFGGTYCLSFHGRRIPQASSKNIDIKQSLAVILVYFSALKMEAIRSSETSVKFYRTARRHMPENSMLFSFRNV
jgi:hypothetical protein